MGELDQAFYTVQKLRMGALVFIAWLFALLIPPSVLGLVSSPDWRFWVLPAVLYGYLGYSGVRAYRKGWRSRFVLRVIVPIWLLVTSAVISAVALWSGVTS